MHFHDCVATGLFENFFPNKTIRNAKLISATEVTKWIKNLPKIAMEENQYKKAQKQHKITQRRKNPKTHSDTSEKKKKKNQENLNIK